MGEHYLRIADALKNIQVIAGANVSLEDEARVRQSLLKIRDNVSECERRYGMINQLMLETPESEDKDDDNNIFLMNAMK